MSFSLEANSIDTNQADRDAHLKSPDFFAADQYTTIDFTGSLAKEEDSEYTLDGSLDNSRNHKSNEAKGRFWRNHC